MDSVPSSLGHRAISLTSFFLFSHPGLTSSSKHQPVGCNNDIWRKDKTWWNQCLFQCLFGNSELPRKVPTFSSSFTLLLRGNWREVLSCAFESHLLGFEVVCVCCHHSWWWLSSPATEWCQLLAKLTISVPWSPSVRMLLPQRLQWAPAHRKATQRCSSPNQPCPECRQRRSFLLEWNGVYSFGFNTIPSGQIGCLGRKTKLRARLGSRTNSPAKGAIAGNLCMFSVALFPV